jgi:protein required for attachment to host cells
MIVPKNTVVMVLDGAKMSLFLNNGVAQAPVLTRIEHADDPAPHTTALGTDRPGRSFQSSGTARSGYEGPDYHQREEDAFALAAATQLNALALDPHASLILVAAPHVLGVMRDHLTPVALVKLRAQIAKDYTDRSAQDIAAMLSNYEA